MQSFLQEWKSNDDRFFRYGDNNVTPETRVAPVASEFIQKESPTPTLLRLKSEHLEAPIALQGDQKYLADFYGRHSPENEDEGSEWNDDVSSVSSGRSFDEAMKESNACLARSVKAEIARLEDEKLNTDEFEFDEESKVRLEQLTQAERKLKSEKSREETNEKQNKRAARTSVQKTPLGGGTPSQDAVSQHGQPQQSPRAATPGSEAATDDSSPSAAAKSTKSQKKAKKGRASVGSIDPEDEHKKNNIFDPDDPIALAAQYDVKMKELRPKMTNCEPDVRRDQLDREKNDKKPKKKLDRQVGEELNGYQTTIDNKMHALNLPVPDKKLKKTGNPVEAVMGAVRRYYKACESIGVHFNAKGEQESNNAAQRGAIAHKVKTLSGHSEFVTPGASLYVQEDS